MKSKHFTALARALRAVRPADRARLEQWTDDCFVIAKVLSVMPGRCEFSWQRWNEELGTAETSGRTETTEDRAGYVVLPDGGIAWAADLEGQVDDERNCPFRWERSKG